MKRLYKKEARKAYDEGTVLVMVPCRMYPNSPWGLSFTLNKKEREAAGKTEPFDTLVQEFEWYNCNYETGYYAAFYIKE